MLEERFQSHGHRSKIKEGYVTENDYLCGTEAKSHLRLPVEWQKLALAQLFQALDAKEEVKVFVKSPKNKA